MSTNFFMNHPVKVIALMLLFVMPLGITWLSGAESIAKEAPVDGYREPIFEPLAFDFQELGMIEMERREYAGNLATFAMQLVQGYANDEGKLSKVPQEKYDLARKMVGLAGHLDPKARVVLVANGRLKAGVLPKSKPEPGMTSATFASLLAGRASELAKTEEKTNIRLAGCFLDLSMAMDPSSDDVIYAHELFLLQGHKADWKGILE